VDLQTYKLTLTTDLYSDGPIDPEVALALNRILHDYCDGRLSFNVEMMIEGLLSCLREAAYLAVKKQMVEKYGNEMVEVAEGHQASRWSIEAKKAFNPEQAPQIKYSLKARIEK